MFNLKDAAIKFGPVIKKAMTGTGKILVQEVVARAGEKAADGIKKAPKKVDEYIDRKKEEAIREAKDEAEVFIAEQMEIIEKRVDLKLEEIEKRLDAKVQSYYKNFIKLNYIVIGTTAVIGSLALLFFYLRKLMGV